jgi:hypothetical protein
MENNGAGPGPDHGGPRNLRAVRRLVPVIASVFALAGCGEDDSGFTAEQFVAAVNQRGASLELGPELRSTREDTQVYALAITGQGERGRAEVHGGGSLTVTPSVEAGAEEWERCDDAASLLCYRADNIVLILEGEVAEEELAALAVALQTIADETSG